MRVKKVSHLFALINNAPIQNISNQQLRACNIQLDIKRDDLLHPIISGNKWRKLKHVLLEIESRGYCRVATMGGQYSNFLHSLSYICKLLNWELELYVRGHPEQQKTPMLHDAAKWGANITYVTREGFRKLRHNPPELSDDVFWISEGGYDQLALKGSVESLMEVPRTYDYLVTAAATGTSLAGYCRGVIQLGFQTFDSKTKVLGVAVLNNGNEIAANVEQLIQARTQIEIVRGYEFGGYAKKTDELMSFIQQFEDSHAIPLDHVYNGKSFFATLDLIEKGYFPSGSRVLLIHTGGLQGNRQV
ncbi:1-aminocyclopropane-1-carboxylate deaminase/D-cysteine desulfhydrase [Aliikangiella coralliicola]|uniref:Pyridoxal-phosphate dependent enzyme n=1 Tax=Aliikangiella coralliicola TaxID=2592383 RepID=A0A545UJW4_9GAMM|nr:pyridoxal-phosphate dependent enzyme [Aliikangiella coralliicola]TQV89760.1 pyridoxal-phosphate dependent enzyme [Aliikangiella coralliicola]